MTFPEYMCGMLYMIAKCTPKDTEVRAAITHAAQVAEDAAGYTWSAVREWSQSCLSHIEQGSEKWVAESDIFTRDRTRLSWLKGKPIREVKVPCHAHNTDKCPERSTHHSEGKTWVHACAVCVYGLGDDPAAQNATSHTCRTCRRKPSLRYNNDDNRGDFRRRPNNHHARKDQKADQHKSKN